MDKILEITLLYDFYGELLTQKQKSVIELYYLDDLSLNEIANAHNITRQAVLDMIKRTEKILMQYELKLKLVDKFLKQKDKLKEVADKLDYVIEEYHLGDIKDVSLIRETINSILD